MHYPPAQLRKIAELLTQHDGLAVSLWVNHQRAETLAVVVAYPRAGLFAALAATLTSGHANIIAAQAFTLSDGRILDVFHLQGEEGTLFNVESDLDRLTSRVQTLIDQDEIEKVNINAAFKVNILMQRVPVRVRELSKASYTETAIEVSAANQPRLLARLANVISSEGYTLHGASISTFGERAVDVFFLQAKQSKPLTTEQISSLCAALADEASLPSSPDSETGR